MKQETNIHKKMFLLQQEIGAISKDASNPFYKSKYFDINSLEYAGRVLDLKDYIIDVSFILHNRIFF